MQRILLLLIIVAHSAFAQEGWVNFPVDQNVEVLFPGKPEVNNNMQYKSASVETPQLSFHYVVFRYHPDSTQRVTNIDQLRSLYEWVLQMRITANGGVIDQSSFEMQRDIMLASASYHMEGYSDPCEVRLLFVKGNLYSFSACGVDGDPEFAEKSATFFRSITINNDLTPADQMTTYVRSFDPQPIGVFSALFYTVLFLVWGLLFIVVTIKGRGGASVGTGLVRLYSIIRWALVGFSLIICVLAIVGAISNVVQKIDEIYPVVFVAAGSFVIALLALFLKGPSSPKPVDQNQL